MKEADSRGISGQITQGVEIFMSLRIYVFEMANKLIECIWRNICGNQLHYFLRQILLVFSKRNIFYSIKELLSTNQQEPMTTVFVFFTELSRLAAKKRSRVQSILQSTR